MLPQFFDLLGLQPQGELFERLFWACLIAAGAIVLIKEWRARHPIADAWYGYAMGLGLMGYGGYYLQRLVRNHQLYFAEDGLQISNYGLSIALAFVLGITLAVREGRRSPAPPDAGQIYDLAFWILIFGMLGARVLFIIVNWREYYHLCVAPELVDGSDGIADCYAVLKLWKGGLVFFGGFLGAASAGYVYCRRHKIPFLKAADVIIPSLALGHCLGRIGCLSAGCCYGKITSAPWGIHMPLGSPAFQDHYEHFIEIDPALANELYTQGFSMLIHPTQLYEASAEFLFFLFLIWMRPRKRFAGQLMALWLILYGGLRFTIEIFRGDTVRGFLFEWPVENPLFLTTSQSISLAVGLGGLLIFFINRRELLLSRGAADNGLSPP
jgi:phosphatidylglycerol:prolipoprotein diacylglycerol transferase